jgi:hypothetical protein
MKQSLWKKYLDGAVEAYEEGNLAKAELLLEKAAFFGSPLAPILLSRLYIEEGMKGEALAVLQKYSHLPDVAIFLEGLRKLDVHGELLFIDFSTMEVMEFYGNLLDESRLILKDKKLTSAIIPKDKSLRTFFLNEIAQLDENLLNLLGDV